jgi:predicted DNA binding CopG/RHH family protein
MREAVVLTIRIERSDVEALEQFAEAAGVTASEYVRNILARHVQAKRRRG